MNENKETSTVLFSQLFRLIPSNFPISVNKRIRRFSLNSTTGILWQWMLSQSIYLVVLLKVHILVDILYQKEQLMEHFKQKTTIQVLWSFREKNYLQITYFIAFNAWNDA